MFHQSSISKITNIANSTTARVIALIGVGTAIVTGSATKNSAPDQSLPVKNLASTSSTASPTSFVPVANVSPSRVDGCEPAPDVPQDSQEYQDWATDQYVYGCTDAAITASQPWFKTNDGWTSSSLYVGRRMTGVINDWMEQQGDAGAAEVGALAGLCGVVAVADPLAGAGCGVVAVAASVNYGALKDAARNAAADGSCIKITEHFGPSSHFYSGNTDISKTSPKNKFCIN